MINGDHQQPAPGDREVHQHYDHARQAYAGGDLDRAEHHCAAALEVEPDFLPALELGGVVACQRGELQQGIGRFRAVTEVAADQPGPWFNLGNALLSAGQLSEAADTLARALSLAPDHPGVLVALGSCERRLGRFEISQSHLERAVELAPRDLAALNALGAVCAQQQQYQRALEMFRRAVAEQPRTAELRTNVGQTLLEMGRYGEAADEFRAALTVSTRDVEARTGLAVALNGLGQYDEAIHHYERVLRARPGHGRALSGLIDTLEHENRLTEANQLLGQALETAPGDTNLLFLKARLAAREGDDKDALAALEAVAPDRVPRLLEERFYAELGEVADRLGRADRAMLAFSRANYAISRRWRAANPGPNAFLQGVRHGNELVRAGALAGLVAGNATGSPVFLVGFPRSGTTLLGRMLNQHDALNVTDERPVLRRLAERLRQDHGGYPDALPSLSATQIAALRLDYLQAFEEAGGRGRLVDKMPLNLVHGALIHCLFGAAPVLLVLRDPRDVVLSCFMQAFDLNSAMANFFTIESTARAYDQVMTLWEQQREVLDLRVLELRYEQLVRQPQQELETLCSKLEVDFQPSMLAYHQRADAGAGIRTPSYRQVGRVVNDAAVGRWQRYAAHLEPVRSVLAPWIERYGYE